MSAYPLLQPMDLYHKTSALFIKYLTNVTYEPEVEEKLLQGFYIGHMRERNKEPLNADEEAALANSWGTPYDIRTSIFIKRMRAKFSSQLLIWINSQIMGNNLAAETYLTLLGIEFYKTHAFGEEVSLKWLDDIEVRGKYPDTNMLYQFNRTLLVKQVHAHPETNEIISPDLYLWDVITRADLYLVKQ